MAQVTLSAADRDRLVDIILKRVGLKTKLDRENFLERAGLLDDCRGNLAWEVEPEPFVRQLIRRLQDRIGTLASTGYPALVSLLRELHRNDLAGHRGDADFVASLLGPFTDDELRGAVDRHLDGLVTAWADTLRQQYVALAGELERRAAATDSPLGELVGRRTVPSRRRGGALVAALEAKVPLVAGDYRAVGQAAPEPVEDVGARLRQAQRAVLLGEPGSGKSWTLARLAVAYADAWDSTPRDERDRALIPIVVPLQRFNGAQSGGRNGDEPAQKLEFAAFVQQAMVVLEPHVDRLLQAGRLVFLCDALNEMPRRCSHDGRDLVAEVRRYLADKPRFVVSCRVRDYGDDLSALGRLAQVQLRELDPPKIKHVIECRFADRPEQAAELWRRMGGGDELLGFWRQVAERDEEERFWDARAEVPDYTTVGEDKAWRLMQRGARLIPLCRNPFLLNMVCEIWADGGGLPANRAALFDRFVTRLLEREAGLAERRGEPWPDGTYQRIEAALASVAAAMQAAGGTVLGRTEVLHAMGEEARWLLDVGIASSILVEAGGGSDEGTTVRFSHQLLQEYFAARVMLAALEADEDPARFFAGGEGWWETGVWRETTVILGELLDDGARGPNRAARWLAPASPEVALEVVLRNGEGLTVEDLEPETQAALVNAAQARTAEPHPAGRAAGYLVLGLLEADDRPGAGLQPHGVPDIAWCKVDGEPPNDEFVYQKGETRRLPTFYVSKYPVTYAQYRAFLDAPDGYANERWWREPVALKQRQPEPGGQYWPIPNHPAENVSWYDAVAFCRWLSTKLGYEVRPPTEEEWEKAARGTDGREYPWGNGYKPGYANIDETWEDAGLHYLRRTTAVGMYPDGCSPCGALDMSGNVWEWTLTEHRSGRSDDLTNEEARVLRGGSWLFNFLSLHYARASYRNFSPPYSRFRHSGFRVVASAPVL